MYNTTDVNANQKMEKSGLLKMAWRQGWNIRQTSFIFLFRYLNNSYTPERRPMSSVSLIMLPVRYPHQTGKRILRAAPPNIIIANTVTAIMVTKASDQKFSFLRNDVNCKPSPSIKSSSACHKDP